MPDSHAGTIKRLRLVQWNRFDWLNEGERLAVRLFPIQVIGLSHTVTLPALHAVVVIEHLLERTQVNHGLLALSKRPAT